MKKYRIVITHNNYSGSLERTLFAMNLKDAESQTRNYLIPHELLTNHHVQIIPHEPEKEKNTNEKQLRID